MDEIDKEIKKLEMEGKLKVNRVVLGEKDDSKIL